LQIQVKEKLPKIPEYYKYIIEDDVSLDEVNKRGQGKYNIDYKEYMRIKNYRGKNVYDNPNKLIKKIETFEDILLSQLNSNLDKIDNDKKFKEEFDEIKRIFNIQTNEDNQKLKNLIYDLKNVKKKNTELQNQINIQNSKMEILSQRISFLEDSFRDFFFECNISLNVKNKGIGICYLNYLPKSINFKIEYNGSLLEAKGDFLITINFPLPKASLSLSSIEKFQGCKIPLYLMNTSEQETIMYHNYSTFVEQKNNETYIKLRKNYSTKGKWEKDTYDTKCNFIIVGNLSFNTLFINYSKSCYLYELRNKKFLSYNTLQGNFIFVDNYNNEDCILNLVIQGNEILIKGRTGKFFSNFDKLNNTSSNEQNSLLNIIFFNKMFGLVSIYKQGSFLTCLDDGSVNSTNEENYIMIINTL
jgi:hypothetical protein